MLSVFAQFLDCVHQLLHQFPMSLNLIWSFSVSFLIRCTTAKRQLFLVTVIVSVGFMPSTACKHSNLSVWDLMGLGPGEENDYPTGIPVCLIRTSRSSH